MMQVPRLNLGEAPGRAPRLNFALPDFELRRLERSRRIHAQVRNAKLEAIERLAARYKDAVAFIRQQRPSETVEAFDAANAATLAVEPLIGLVERLERVVGNVEDRADTLEDQARVAREAAKTPAQLLEDRLQRIEAENRVLRARLDARQAPRPAPSVEPPPLTAARMAHGYAGLGARDPGAGEPGAVPANDRTRLIAEDRR